MFETRALQTSPELHAIAPAAYPDGNRCKANPSLSAKKKNRAAEAVLFFKEREVFETRALQTPPELHAIAPAAYLDGNRCKANPSLRQVKLIRIPCQFFCFKAFLLFPPYISLPFECLL